MDMYQPLTQLKALEVLPQEFSFLYEMFVEEGEAVTTEKAEYDYKKGTQRMAAFVENDAGGVVMERDGFDTRDFMFPTLMPERIIKASDLRQRMFGENIYSGRTPEDRARKMMADDLMYLRKAIALRKEWMTAQLLFTGKMDLKVFVDAGLTKTAPYTINFGFDNKYTATTPWTDAASDPVVDQEALMTLVMEGQGYVDTIVMAPDVMAALIKNEKFMKKLDLKNGFFGDLAIKYKNGGVRYLGINHTGVEMFVYAGKYKDDNGNDVAFVPAGNILFGNRKMLQVNYGPVTQLEKADGDFKTYLTPEVPLRYADIGSSTKKQRLTSRPFIKPKNVDGWAVGDVL